MANIKRLTMIRKLIIIEPIKYFVNFPVCRYLLVIEAQSLTQKTHDVVIRYPWSFVSDDSPTTFDNLALSAISSRTEMFYNATTRTR